MIETVISTDENKTVIKIRNIKTILFEILMQKNVLNSMNLSFLR